VIASAIYDLLNVADVTNLAPVYYGTVPQQKSAPYIVFRESALPEHNKVNTKTIIHEIEIVIVSEKGKNGTAGFTVVEPIGDMIHTKLNKFSGLSGGKSVAMIRKNSEDVYYDQTSQFAVMEMVYEVRENVNETLAVVNFPQTLNVYVNGVLNQSVTVNAYNNNTINIT